MYLVEGSGPRPAPGIPAKHKYWIAFGADGRKIRVPKLVHAWMSNGR